MHMPRSSLGHCSLIRKGSTMYFSFSWLWWVAAVVPQAAAFPLNDFSEAATTNYSAIYSPCLSSSAHIYYPYQANYNTSVLQRASTWDSPTFAVTVKPACNSDVECVVSETSTFQTQLSSLIHVTGQAVEQEQHQVLCHWWRSRR